jgi:hypothetical protein
MYVEHAAVLSELPANTIKHHEEIGLALPVQKIYEHRRLKSTLEIPVARGQCDDRRDFLILDDFAERGKAAIDFKR